MAELDQLAERFFGVTLAHRRGGTDWPKPWRCRLYTNKNERAAYRLTTYGDTSDEAVRAMHAAVAIEQLAIYLAV